MDDYWKYLDVLVPIDIERIPSIDGYNDILYLGGNSYMLLEDFTDTNPYTLDEYHNTFCIYDEDLNEWVYNG